jgi:NAD(P)-dependent dehydrogenase (short-subunit alcohol dehydrogenase family)
MAAKKGMNVFGVHLDRKSAMPMVEELIEELKREGVEARFFNVNAADQDRRREVLDEVREVVGPEGGVRVLMHSLAFGILRPFISPEGAMEQQQMDMTSDVMGHSLVYWVQEMVARDLFDRNGRIFAMTSAGGTKVLPNYGAVSAAKAALESHIRQLAMELAPLQVTANAIRAGVTDTPALRKIPGNERIIDMALAKNPTGRLTTPEDVAHAILLLSEPASYWMTGNTLGVDGGEDIVG